MVTASTDKRGRAVGAAAAAVATAALACGVCCVLPIALPAIALTSTGSVLAWWGRAHTWATGMAVGVVVLGWFWVWRQSAQRGARPARATLWLMGLATLVTAGALAWPCIEPLVLHTITG